MRLPPEWVFEYAGRQNFVVAVDTLSLSEEQQLGEVYRAQLLYLFGANINRPLDEIFDPIVRLFVAVQRDDSSAMDGLWQRLWDAIASLPFAEFVTWFVDSGLDTSGMQDRDKPFEYRTPHGNVRPRVIGADTFLASLRTTYESFTPDERERRLAAISGGAIFVD